MIEWHVSPWTRSRRTAAGMRPGRGYADRAVIERDGLMCQICGVDVDADDVHIDHIHPVSLGGRNQLDNLQVAHSFCNLSKGAR